MLTVEAPLTLAKGEAFPIVLSLTAALLPDNVSVLSRRCLLEVVSIFFFLEQTPPFLPLPAGTPCNEAFLKVCQSVSYYILLWLHCGSICQEIWNWSSRNHTWNIHLWVGSLSAMTEHHFCFFWLTRCRRLIVLWIEQFFSLLPWEISVGQAH